MSLNDWKSQITEIKVNNDYKKSQAKTENDRIW